MIDIDIGKRYLALILTVIMLLLQIIKIIYLYIKHTSKSNYMANYQHITFSMHVFITNEIIPYLTKGVCLIRIVVEAV